jgi:hypothetical protein
MFASNPLAITFVQSQPIDHAQPRQPDRSDPPQQEREKQGVGLATAELE